MIRRANQQGYTLVELMLAIAFIGFVILFTVLAILQVMRTYNKGLSVKEINQTARATLDDMSRTAGGSRTINTSALSNGRVCFSGVSYVWNAQNQSANKFTDNSRVTFVRVNDAAGAMCSNSSGTYPNVPPADATPILSDRIWVQVLYVTSPASQGIATITLQLSTPDVAGNSTLIKLPETPPTDDAPTGYTCSGGSGSEFCAVATFSTNVSLKGDK